MGFDLQNDLSPARWVADRIHDFGVDVNSVVPEGFEAYVRLLHPAWRSEGREDVPVSWGARGAAWDELPSSLTAADLPGWVDRLVLVGGLRYDRTYVRFYF
jgi:hypothetical protein